jgi:hypothetical protein
MEIRGSNTPSCGLDRHEGVPDSSSITTKALAGGLTGPATGEKTSAVLAGMAARSETLTGCRTKPLNQ